MTISKQELQQLAEKVVNTILSGDNEVIQILKPILDVKCPFAKLDTLGKHIGKAGAGSDNAEAFFTAFDSIIEYNAMGSFVIVGQALIHFLPDHFKSVMEKSKEYIIKGDTWYVCDIIGERSPGHALVAYFDETIPWFEKFLEDECKWVQRSVGVAIHFFSKRVLDQPEKTKELLTLVEPHLERKQTDFAKGVGWGLKTIGKHHPDILMQFLETQLRLKRDISKTIMRKAMTYLEEDKKVELKGF